MAEYIEREIAIKVVKKEREFTGEYSFEEEHAWAVGFHQGISFALSDISSIPAADVAPVRHGLWAELRVGDIGQAEQIVLFGCSECGVTSWYATPFCGHCGAKMGVDE